MCISLTTSFSLPIFVSKKEKKCWHIFSFGIVNRDALRKWVLAAYSVIYNIKVKTRVLLHFHLVCHHFIVVAVHNIGLFGANYNNNSVIPLFLPPLVLLLLSLRKLFLFKTHLLWLNWQYAYALYMVALHYFVVGSPIQKRNSLHRSNLFLPKLNLQIVLLSFSISISRKVEIIFLADVEDTQKMVHATCL